VCQSFFQQPPPLSTATNHGNPPRHHQNHPLTTKPTSQITQQPRAPPPPIPAAPSAPEIAPRTHCSNENIPPPHEQVKSASQHLHLFQHSTINHYSHKLHPFYFESTQQHVFNATVTIFPSKNTKKCMIAALGLGELASANTKTQLSCKRIESKPITQQ